MAFDLSRLTTWAMCDRAKALALVVQKDLEFDRTLTARHGNLAEAGADTTDANLLAVSAEHAALSATVAGMAAGPVREKYERKLRRLTERRNQLTDRLTDFDGVELTDNEFDLHLIDKALEETTAYLAAVAAQRATLNG